MARRRGPTATSPSRTISWFWRDQSRPGTRHYLRGAQEDSTEYRCHKQLGDDYAQLRRFPAARDCSATAVRLAPEKWILFVRLAAAEESWVTSRRREPRPVVPTRCV